MPDKLNKLRELIFKCEEVKKDILRITKEKEVLQNLANYYHEAGHSEALRAINMACDELDNEIGRDITLEDVLRALISKSLLNTENLSIRGVSQMNKRKEVIFHYQFQTFSWQLGKPIQDQSEECIDSLIKLLK